MTADVLQHKPTVESVDIGLKDEARQRLATGLTGNLADTFALLVKTLGYHWNVVGPLFHSLHEMTEDQYKDLFDAADDLAERIRALGFPAPSAYAEMAGVTAVEDSPGIPSAEEMVRDLISSNELVVRRMREVALTAEELEDTVTHDLLTERMGEHEKTIWMLKAIVSA
jgi:starvation-inducible DNA-binding protein